LALTLVLIMIEITDVLFALDLIPATYGITRDPFIVYTSNRRHPVTEEPVMAADPHSSPVTNLR